MPLLIYAHVLSNVSLKCTCKVSFNVHIAQIICVTLPEIHESCSRRKFPFLGTFRLDAIGDAQGRWYLHTKLVCWSLDAADDRSGFHTVCPKVKHVIKVCQCVTKMIGFIIRNTADFRNLCILKLEYSSISAPHQTKYVCISAGEVTTLISETVCHLKLDNVRRSTITITNHTCNLSTFLPSKNAELHLVYHFLSRLFINGPDLDNSGKQDCFTPFYTNRVSVTLIQSNVTWVFQIIYCKMIYFLLVFVVFFLCPATSVLMFNIYLYFLLYTKGNPFSHLQDK